MLLSAALIHSCIFLNSLGISIWEMKTNSHIVLYIVLSGQVHQALIKYFSSWQHASKLDQKFPANFFYKY
jgi:hypothetical protein